MIKIVVVNRPSNVAAQYVSRSISARLLEPLHYLGDQGLLQFSVTNAGHPHDQANPDWAFFNKAMDENSFLFAQSLKTKGIRILYDIDDHILAYPSYSGAKPTAKNIDIAKKFIDMSDVVTVANENIRQLYQSMRPDVSILPNGIYVERYAPNGLEIVRGAPLRVGLVNADFMKIVNFKSDWTKAIDELKKRYPELFFSYYGDFAPNQLGLEGWHWLGGLEFDDYRRSLFKPVFDIALVPLGGEEDPESHAFNSCKNPFKFLEFGASGIVGIYSNVSVYRSVVTHGVTGFLANSNYREWTDAAIDLIENEELRSKIAHAGRAEVMQRHHVRFAASVLSDILNRGTN